MSYENRTNAVESLAIVLAKLLFQVMSNCFSSFVKYQIVTISCVFTVADSQEGTPLFGLYGDMPLDRVWTLALLS